MPVFLLPKPKKKKKLKISWELITENKTITFSLGILLLAVIVYGGVSLYTNVLSGRIELIRSEAENIENQRNIETENNVLEFDQKLSSISSLLDTHRKSSKLFAFMESITHPNVYFIDFNLQADDGTVVLNGSTENYATFGEQYIALEENGKVKDLRVFDVKLSQTGKVEFGLSFKVDKSLYQ